MVAVAVQIYAGARSPESLTITWQRRDLTFATSEVASGVLVVSDGAVSARWKLDLISATDSTVVLEHEFDADGEETSRSGTFTAALLLLDSGGTILRRSEPMSMTVLEYPR